MVCWVQVIAPMGLQVTVLIYEVNISKSVGL